MTKPFLYVLFVFIASGSAGQQTPADSLRQQLRIAKKDTMRASLLAKLSLAYVFSKPDSGLYLASEGLQLARKIDYAYGEAQNLFSLATYFRITGDSRQGMQFANNALAVFKTINKTEGIILCTNMLGWLALDQKDYRRALGYSFEAKQLSENNNDYALEYSYSTTAESYERLEKLDSALIYAEKAESVPQDYNWNLIVLSGIHAKLNNDSLSLKYYRKAISKTTFSKDSSDAFIGMAKVFNKIGETDSAIHYLKKALGIAKDGNFLFEVLSASEVLAKIYKKDHVDDSTLKYMQINIDAKDSLFSQEKVKQFQSLVFNEKLHRQEIDADKAKYKARIRSFVLLIAAGFFLFLTIILYRNNKLKQRANARLQQQKEIVENTLVVLKSTQAQLIQSEKMASLGELTAGIAHEIQNPLNFVNNFSEVNKELVADLAAEIDKGNYDAAKAIAKDITGNEEKINHHGKRADSIVKGMLQHARTTEGQKEPTDINALADEYIRLAYHGMRTRDNSFKAIPIVIGIETNFEHSIGKLNIVPQEIGRVILNLLNNAFYAVNEKVKLRSAAGGYEPRVVVGTKKTSDKVEIVVKDNGDGIPQKILDKIFQPFFTTKPTGQGTGLGLSLAYDIVKAHGGEIKVNTKEGESTEFTIWLFK